MGDNDIELVEAMASTPGEEPGVLDKIVGRIISRKFFVFLMASGLLAWSI